MEQQSAPLGLGFGDDLPFARKIFITNNDSGFPWHFWEIPDGAKPEEGHLEPIKAKRLTFVVEAMYISQKEFKGKVSDKLNVVARVSDSERYIIFTGLETTFARGFLLQMLKVVELYGAADGQTLRDLPIVMIPRLGDSKTVFCNLMVGNQSIRVDWDRDTPAKALFETLVEQSGIPTDSSQYDYSLPDDEGDDSGKSKPRPERGGGKTKGAAAKNSSPSATPKLSDSEIPFDPNADPQLIQAIKAQLVAIGVEEADFDYTVNEFFVEGIREQFGLQKGSYIYLEGLSQQQAMEFSRCLVEIQAGTLPMEVVGMEGESDEQE